MKQPGRPMRPGQVDSSTRRSLIMVASTPPPVRASDAERERTVRALRERSAEGQLSFDTFVRRIDRAFRARSRDELAALVDDLPPQGRIARRLTDAAFALSAFTARLEAAWREPRCRGSRSPRSTTRRSRSAVLKRATWCFPASRCRATTPNCAAKTTSGSSSISGRRTEPTSTVGASTLRSSSAPATRSRSAA